MPITALPAAPSRADPTNFPTRGDALLGQLPTFVDEANALALDVNAKQALATTAAAAAQAASIAAQAAANYKGLWTGLTGALNIPAAVFHANNFWVLTASLANVTTATPGVSSVWQMMNGTMVSPAMAPVVGAASVDAAQALLLNGQAWAGFRNVLINGGFDVQQSGSSGSLGGYNADQWVASWTGATGTWNVFLEANNAAGGNTPYLQLNGASGVTDANLSQRIEAANSRHLAGKTVTVSYWVYHTKAAAQIFNTFLSYPTALDNFSSVTAVASVATPSIAPATWTYVTATFAVPLAAVTGLNLTCLGGLGSLVPGQSAAIKNVQLELGSVATPFERRSYGVELAMCQRYFERVGYMRWDLYANATASDMFLAVGLKVQKRATPTITPNGVTTSFTGVGYGTSNGDFVLVNSTGAVAGDNNYAWNFCDVSARL
jgi:hypothetical protein